MRNILRNERLMLRVSGKAIGYPQTVLCPAIMWSYHELQGWSYYTVLSLTWSALLVLLSYYSNRVGAVTLAFAASMPWFFQFWMLLYQPPAPFDPVASWWIYSTVPLAVLLIAIEYAIKLFLAFRMRPDNRLYR